MRQGDKATARRLLYQALRTNPRSVAAWLWLSAVVDDAAKEQECLERVLAIDPGNEVAQRHLDQLTQAKGPHPEPQQAPGSHVGPAQPASQPRPSQPFRKATSTTTESQPAKSKWTGHILLIAVAALLVIVCLPGSCCVLLSREVPSVGTPRSTPSPTWPATWTLTPRATATSELATIPMEGSLWCPDCAAEGMPINLWERGSANRGRIVAQAYHGDEVVVLDRNRDAEENRYYYEVGVLKTGAIGWVPETLIQLFPTTKPTWTPVPEVTSPPLSEDTQGIVQSLRQFEESQFCHTYSCRFGDS